MSLLDSATLFLDKIFTHLHAQNIELNNWEIDHLCYRTDSEEHYQEVKAYFETCSKLLIESEVGGRMIATYKLNQPISYQIYVIDLIEVPAPKPSRKTDRGFEHIEVIIDEDFESFQGRYPEIEFLTKGLAKDLNPELEIEFEDCAVKFHHKSLEHIINIEKEERITRFLDETEVLKKLKAYHPNISGTLPLEISTEESDLDILCQAKDFNSFLSVIKNTFSNQELEIKQQQEYLTVNFNYYELPIEIYCEKQSVYKQNANQHFLIEGRLLKLLGEDLRKDIIAQKKAGSKTEPAFGEILGLNDPYQELIQLNKLSDAELLKRFKH